MTDSFQLMESELVSLQQLAFSVKDIDSKLEIHNFIIQLLSLHAQTSLNVLNLTKGNISSSVPSVSANFDNGEGGLQ